jgi:thymidylate kinase
MKRKLLIVELAGPAGVGKTTIRNALTKSHATMQFAPFPQIRELQNLPFFLWNFTLLLPVLFALYLDQKQKSFTIPFLARLAILNGWSVKLNALRRSDISVLILDQGPVYLLAELLRHGPPNFRGTVPAWWDRVCKAWANTLDIVICLDSPDAILLQRNRTREKNHGIKQNADDWATPFLAESRKAQSEVLKSMVVKPEKVKFLEIDTSQSSLRELVQKITCLLDEEKKRT